MSDVKPLTYTLDEARKQLRDPPLSRGTMYDMINNGALEVAGYFGDRPFFTPEVLQNCTERLKQRRKPGRPKRARPSADQADRPRRRLAREGAR